MIWNTLGCAFRVGFWVAKESPIESDFLMLIVPLSVLAAYPNVIKHIASYDSHNISSFPGKCLKSKIDEGITASSWFYTCSTQKRWASIRTALPRWSSSSSVSWGKWRSSTSWIRGISPWIFPFQGRPEERTGDQDMIVNYKQKEKVNIISPFYHYKLMPEYWEYLRGASSRTASKPLWTTSPSTFSPSKSPLPFWTGSPLKNWSIS